jgi:WD40 repeat protein
VNDEPGQHTPDATLKFQAVRLPLLSRQAFLVIGLLFLGTIAVGIISEDSPRWAATHSLTGHENLIESVAYTPDGRTLLSCGWDSTVRLWNVEEGASDWGMELARLSHASHLFTMALTPDGRYLATGSVHGFTIWTRSIRGGWDKALERAGSPHRAVAASPDGRTIAVGGVNGSVRLWDVSTLQPMVDLPGLRDEVRDLAYSADGSFLVGSAFDGSLRAWSVTAAGEGVPLPLNCDGVFAFAINPTSRVLATSHGEAADCRLSLWDVHTGKETRRLKSCEMGNNVLAFSPDGRLLASGDKDNRIRLRHSGTGELLATLDDDLGWVKTLAFSPDGRRIAFGGRDGGIRFREVPPEAADRGSSVPQVAGNS